LLNQSPSAILPKSHLIVARQSIATKTQRRSEMNDRKHTFKVLCIASLAALSAMALFAASAQAKGDWKIESVTTTGTARFLGSTTGLTFKSTVGTLTLKITCNKLDIDDGLLFVGGGSLAELLLKECTTYLGDEGIPSNGCKPQEPVTLLAKGLLIVHTNETFDLFTPDVGNNFGTFRLGTAKKEEKEEKELTEEQKESGLEEGCPSVIKFPLSGSFVLQCSTTGCTTENASHPMEQAAAGLFPNDVLMLGGRTARLEGVATWKLDAPNENKKWSYIGL